MSSAATAVVAGSSSATDFLNFLLPQVEEADIFLVAVEFVGEESSFPRDEEDALLNLET